MRDSNLEQVSLNIFSTENETCWTEIVGWMRLVILCTCRRR
jgi:hypothetical protein